MVTSPPHVRCERCGHTTPARDATGNGWTVTEVQGEYYGRGPDGEPLFVKWLEVVCAGCRKGVQ